MMLDAAMMAAASGPAVAFGLGFVSRIGLAAGIDRTGRELPRLGGLGFGHIEIGTVTRGCDVEIDRSRLPAGLRIGVNFASSIPGLDPDVVEDYAAIMTAAWDRADFLVANLTSPRGGRSGETPGVSALLTRLKDEQRRLAAETGTCRPLLVKVDGGGRGEATPTSIVAAGRLALDGVVLVSSSLGQIRAVRAALRGGTVVSVGGISTAADIADRLSAGAALVQVHTAFTSRGCSALCGIMAPCPD